jgi:1,4-dihydroxy-2-naphthoate octaprenyltransferase
LDWVSAIVSVLPRSLLNDSSVAMTSISEAVVSRAGEPDPAVLGGSSLVVRVKRGLLATRPKFFAASVLPVVVGTGWGYRQSGELNWSVFLLALGATVLVHAASNVWNDIGDDINGTDRLNDERIHPYTGGSRFIQNGVLDRQAMLRLSVGLASAGLVLGVTLVWLKGMMVLLLGVSGAALGYLYSSPTVRLNGRGVGETAVAIAFGVLPVCGAAWLQSGVISWPELLLAVPVSSWVAAILLVNEVPDRKADGISGKRTLAVRLGTQGTALLYAGLHSIAMLAAMALVILGALPTAVLLVPLVLLGVGFAAARKIAVGSRSPLKQSIEMTLTVHGVGCLWLVSLAWL